MRKRECLPRPEAERMWGVCEMAGNGQPGAETARKGGLAVLAWHARGGQAGKQEQSETEPPAKQGPNRQRARKRLTWKGNRKAMAIGALLGKAGGEVASIGISR